MPQFVVRKGHDAFVYYETVVEAGTTAEARQLAGDIMYEGEWIATGDVSEFDDYEIDSIRPLEEGEIAEDLVSIGITFRERDAMIAGLRLLQIAMHTGEFEPMVRQIYTNDGAHDGIDPDAIDPLCERINV